MARLRIRIGHAHSFKLVFWTWDSPIGTGRDYYDGWHNWINFGLLCLCWVTPPLKGDLYEEKE